MLLKNAITISYMQKRFVNAPFSRFLLIACGERFFKPLSNNFEIRIKFCFYYTLIDWFAKKLFVHICLFCKLFLKTDIFELVAKSKNIFFC